MNITFNNSQFYGIKDGSNEKDDYKKFTFLGLSCLLCVLESWNNDWIPKNRTLC